MVNDVIAHPLQAPRNVLQNANVGAVRAPVGNAADAAAADAVEDRRPPAATRLPVVTPHTTLLELARSPRLRRVFGEFLQNVFMQLDTDAFTTVLQRAAAAHPDNYENFYKALQGSLGEARPGVLTGLRRQLKSLGVLRDTLSSQIGQLASPGLQADGYAEIGYPGRLVRPLKNKGARLTGQVAVVSYGESVLDYVEAGFPRPNDTFVALDGYAPIDRRGALTADSLDMVVVPIGLHHAPLDKLPEFIASIARVLRPGGTFVLREHDVPAGRGAMAMMAHAAHSVFNVATGVSWEEERDEVRHFRSLDAWQTLLDQHGFDLVGTPLITEGDPSRNALMRFVKRPAEPAQALSALEREMRMSAKDYQRPACQTYLTTLEWHLVHTAREQADFAATKPPHKYPYLEHVGTLWKNFIASVREGVAAGGVRSLPAEYVLMNLFMVVCTSAEHLWRRATLLPLYLMPEAVVQNSAGGAQLRETQEAYAAFITHTPFFNFPFMQHLRKQWAAVGAGGWRKAPINLWLALVASAEYGAKAAVSAPLAAFYEDGDFTTIHMALRDPDGRATPLLADNEVVKRQGDYTVIKTERYLPFMQKVENLLSAGAEVASIAGQSRVQLKVRVSAGAGNMLAGVRGCRALGEIPIHTGGGDRYLRIDADVSALRDVFVNIARTPGAALTYLHDF